MDRAWPEGTAGEAGIGVRPFSSVVSCFLKSGAAALRCRRHHGAGTRRARFSPARTLKQEGYVNDKQRNGQGLARILRAARCSREGLRAAWKNEAAFRQEALLTLILMPLALWLGEDGVERALLGGSLLLVLVVELLNSAIEAAIDRIGPERHELAGRAKDLSSAAVACTLGMGIFVWVCVLWP